MPTPKKKVDPTKLKKSEIQPTSPAIKDAAWQKFRNSLHGLSTEAKMQKLAAWKSAHPGRKGVVQVENYKNALRRGGQLPPKKKSK